MSHGSAIDRKTYVLVFLALFVLTIIEVAITYVPGISKGLLVSALILLALSKAACVLLWYMHLSHETKVLKMTVILPFAFPALYAFVLIAEAMWRGAWGVFG